METIMKHFKDGLIACVATILMLSIIFTGIRDEGGNVGILNMLGPIADFTEFNYRNFDDFKHVVTESQKALPVVTYDLTKPGIKAGQDILLTDYIEAGDHQGIGLEIKVKKILKDGADMTDLYDKNTKIVNFSTSGVYEVYIAVVDDTRRIQNKKVEIPVNRR